MCTRTRILDYALAAAVVLALSLPAAAATSVFVTVPNFGEEATTWCGAAVGQMIMAGYPTTPCTPTQTDVWDAIQFAKAEPSWDSDPAGLRMAMKTLCPPPGGNWVVHAKPAAAALMHTVAYWMNKNKYPVAVLLSTAPHNTNGAHKERWVMVKGIVTDKDPLTNSAVTLQYIMFVEQAPILGDPPLERFVNGATWYTEFQAVSNAASTYNGQFVAVIEPPAVNGTAGFTSFPITGTVVSASRVLAGATSGIARSGVTQLAAFRELARSTPGTPLLVNGERNGYFLVPYGPAGKPPTYAVAVNAYNGEFMEAALVPSRALLSEREVAAVVSRYLGRVPAQYKAALVSEGKSRMSPEWRVTAEGQELLVDAQGNIRRLPPVKGNCEVKVNGLTILTVRASDRNDCYRQTSFGSENCRRYAQYFKPGVNLLEQFFKGNDRVNNNRCVR